mmetsp:Transcript_15469/g.38090  ORF Transcript_15469/g.38090 Transcript_15469/m.38090 type:complete len:1226 (-) Transcript_15469:68-3745(-)
MTKFSSSVGYSSLPKKTKDKAEYKLLDSVIRTTDGSGQEKAISHKCAEMDKQVPLLMGVSKAVLENVIFCHQEDSNWPLSESKNLKQKFDDIFSATRWTKLQDSIYKKRKDINSKIKALTSELDVLGNNLTTAQKIQNDIRKQTEEIQTRRKKKGRYEEFRTTQMGKLHEIMEIGSKLKEMRNDITVFQRELSNLISARDKARENLPGGVVIEETLDNLEIAGESVKKKITRTEQKIENSNTKLEEIRGNIEDFQKSSASLNVEIGEANAAERRYQNDKKECERIARRCAEKYRTFNIEREGPLDESKFDMVCQELRKLDRDHVNQIMKHKEEASRSDKEFEETIARLRSSVTRLEANQRMYDDEKEKIDKNLRELKERKVIITNKLNNRSDADINVKIQAAEEELKDLSEECDLNVLAEKINETQKRLKSNAADLEIKKVEYREMDCQNESRKKILFQEELVKKSKQKIQEMFESKRQSIELALGSSTSLSTVEENFKRCCKNNQDSIDVNEEKISLEDRTISAKEGELKTMKEQLRRIEDGIEKELALFKRKNVDVENKNFDDVISELERRHAHAREQLENWEPLTKAYSMFKKMAHKSKSHRCPLCKRGMDGAELNKFDQTIQDSLAKLDNANRQAFADKERKYRDQLSMFRQLSGNWATYQSLVKQRPVFQNNVSKLEKEVLAMKSSHKRWLNLRDELIGKKNDLNRLNATVNDIKHMQTQVEQDSKQIDDEKAKLKSNFDVNKFNEIRDDISRIEKKKESFQSLQIELIAKQQKYQSKRGKLQEELREYRKKKEDHERLHLELESCDEAAAKQTEKKQELDLKAEKSRQEIMPYTDRIRNMQHERKKNKEKHQNHEKVLQMARDKIQQELRELQRKTDSVKKHGASSARERHQGLFTKKGKIEEKIREEEGKRDDIGTQIETFNKKLKALKKKSVQIGAMIDYSKKQRSMLEKRKQIEDLQEQLKSKGGLNIGESEEKLRETIQNVQSKIDLIQGRINAQQEQIQRFEAELKTPRLKDVEERHRKAMIECHVYKIGLNDLEVYSRALEKALMEYHSAKMAEINEVLRDYWQTTYCGHDIEEIQIRSNLTEEKRGRRQYNYRVIMKQRDTELNMRGRCSAGQKVLASILIRLALAETFCTRCGVLALDEPTTNLDQANIRQLAKALNQIIGKRADQRNFQIIVITHDEEFVEMLGQRDYCDYYYRVSKDEDQCSTIKQQPF